MGYEGYDYHAYHSFLCTAKIDSTAQTVESTSTVEQAKPRVHSKWFVSISELVSIIVCDFSHRFYTFYKTLQRKTFKNISNIL